MDKEFAEAFKEEIELDEWKYNWAVIDTANKNRVQVLSKDEKGARDSLKYATFSKHDYHYGKDIKTLKVVKLKKAHKNDDIGDPLKEEVELDEASLGSMLNKKAKKLGKKKKKVDEAAPANSVAGGNVNLDPHKKKKRINAKVKWEDFAGARVYVVSGDRWHASRLGKGRYSRYEKYVGNDKLGETIRLYGRMNPKSPIILKNEDNGAMLYLKYGGSKRKW